MPIIWEPIMRSFNRCFQRLFYKILKIFNFYQNVRHFDAFENSVSIDFFFRIESMNNVFKISVGKFSINITFIKCNCPLQIASVETVHYNFDSRPAEAKYRRKLFVKFFWWYLAFSVILALSSISLYHFLVRMRSHNVKRSVGYAC